MEVRSTKVQKKKKTIKEKQSMPRHEHPKQKVISLSFSLIKYKIFRKFSLLHF